MCTLASRSAFSRYASSRSTEIGHAPSSVWKMNSCSTGSGAPPEVSERHTDSHVRTWDANASAIPASAPIRARTSPERFVSCVCVTSRLRGKRRWPLEVRGVELARRDTRTGDGSPPTSFKASSRA